jgi:hypothetical protein
MPFLPSCITVQQLVTAICARAGVSVTGVFPVAEYVDGYAITRQMSARNALEQVKSLYFLVGRELPSSADNMLWTPDGTYGTLDIGDDDLAAHEIGSARPPAVEISRMQPIEIPTRVRVHYPQTDQSLEPGEQSAVRQMVGSDQVADVEFAISMTSAKAAQVAERLLYEMWVGQNTYTFTVGGYLIALEPGDSVMLPVDGTTVRVKIVTTELVLPNLLKVQAVRQDVSVYDSIAPGADGQDIGTDAPLLDSGTADLVVMDLPMLAQEFNDAGYYVAVGVLNGDGAVFNGGGVYRSADAGANFSLLAEVESRSTIGEVLVALPSASSLVMDVGNDLLVSLQSADDVLESTTDAALLTDVNAAAIGQPGRWEIVQFLNAELIDDSPPTWKLSGLLRGRKGTEDGIGTSVAGDRFVLLDSSVLHVPLDLGAVGATRVHRGVLTGGVIEDAPDVTVSLTGRALRPYSVVSVEGTRDAGDLTLTWVRRSRVAQELADGVELPLGEATEAYEIDVMDGVDVVRTLTSATPTVAYTAAEQTTDFGSAQDPLTVRIYQMSSLVGRGIVAEATV